MQQPVSMLFYYMVLPQTGNPVLSSIVLKVAMPP
jgi:hypothetical protein